MLLSVFLQYKIDQVQKMKFFVAILVALILNVNCAFGLWSMKCKDAENSSDKVIRLIQNANCTLIEESRKFHENLNNLREKMRSKVDALKGLFQKNKEVTENEVLDHDIDVRMSKDDDALSSRTKRNKSQETEHGNTQTIGEWN